MGMFEPGAVVTVTGDKGSGKSNTAHVLCEIALKKYPELEIISNVMLDPKINPEWPDFDRYHHFVGEADFLWWLSKCKRPMALFDECGVFSSSGASDSGENRKRRGQLESFLKLIRKWDMNMIWIDQVFEGSVPPAVRSMTSYNIDLPDRGIKDIYNVDSHGNRFFMKRYPNRVLTKIPYLHQGMSSFELDLPGPLSLGDVYKVCSNVHPDHFRKTLRKWLLSNYVVPPKNAGFPAVAQRRENTVGSEGEGSPLPVLRKFRFRGISPDEKIPGRVRVWSILQVKPRMGTPDIMNLTNLGRSAVQQYRNEFTGRLKVNREK